MRRPLSISLLVSCLALFFAGAARADRKDYHEQDLKGKDFTKGDLKSADVQAQFAGANAKGCDFSKADLRGANLRGMNWMNSDMVPRFRGAIYGDYTIWPEGFDPKAPPRS